jgi:protein-S-isoprenylcysteine O-methyltransferase Ste14
MIITLLPILFLTILFGGGATFQRKNIDMDGEPPIGRRIFYLSKYSILLVWAAMLVHIWGVNLSFATVPSAVRGISIVLWIFGFSLLLLGRLEMGDSFRIGSPKESTGLKVHGLFRFSRNPMYVGVYSTVLAPILYTLNPVIVAAGVFIIAVHHAIVLAEEQFLQREFGAEYREYCSRVRRYI